MSLVVGHGASLDQVIAAIQAWAAKVVIRQAGGLELGTRDASEIQLKTNGITRVVVTASGHVVRGGGAGDGATQSALIAKVVGIPDNTATTVFTVTVPNGNHGASIKLRFLSSNGSTDAFESSRTAEGTVVLARTIGGATVATAVAISDAAIATVSGGATHTLAYAVTAPAGVVSASQTVEIQVTIDDSGNLGNNQVVAMAEVLNAEALGVTIR